ncbi:lipid-A-disaccharide kinase [Sphaerotilus hippei]|uniref:Tetraacyldisaccharide 4'-kinase n=1 Tax=Sphaerotilus hippei TaxID=744406 RepID=A0A318H2N2_9BURK|nr:tetraacyldisaccharide 4'-kinase [Sphaerotilus hippei]PXW95029.1 lipid-A-disaccharide kinase [Sphaerotilus hippei]
MSPTPPRGGPATPARLPWALRIEAHWRQPGLLWWTLLWPLSLLYRGASALRRQLYRRGLLKAHALPVPVLVVGNRVAGGAGKTPTTIALVQGLQQRGRSPGILSRGFGGRHAVPTEVTAVSSATDVGDEPLLMQRRTGVPVWVGRDRVAAGHALLARHPEVDVLLCDDGLQHLRLRRDLEVVVFDERGAGNGHLLPAGPLREAVHTPSTARRQWQVYNAPQASLALPGHLARRRLTGLVALADWWHGRPPDPATLPDLRPRPMLASAGIGQPARFFDALRTLGLERLTEWPLADHQDLATLPWPADTADLVLTEKDAIKLDPQRLAHERPAMRVWVAPLGFELPEALLDEVAHALGSKDGARSRAR